MLILVTVVLTLSLGAKADTTSSISANFNNTAISSGRYVWLTAVAQTSGLGTSHVTIFVRKSSVTFTANGTTYTIQAPDTNIIYDPNGTTATATFNPTTNQWQLYRLSSTSDFTLLSAVEFPVPQVGLPGGIKNVKWQLNLSTDTPGIGVKWMWAAAVYPTFSTNYNALGVKPVDDQTLSQYQNTDHAGCPENYKQYVTAGGTGTGGTNCVGLYTSTVVVNPPIVVAPTAKVGGPYSGYAGQVISFNGSGSTDPDGYPLNYSWNFGDGTTGTGATPTHAYSSAGTFTVMLTVDDGRNVTGSSTTSASITLPPPPTITATVNPAPNANGWNNSNVTVTFTCTDSISGIKTCTSPVTVTTQGANQVVQGTATNNGGVSATTSVKVSIDKTPPTIAATSSPAPDSAGWNNSNVTVTFTCADSLSGVAQCPSPILVSASGANQAISGTVTDKAGNTASTAVNLSIEETPPSIVASVSPLPNTNGWNNSSVTVSFTCTQSTSPITSCPPAQVVSMEGANQVITGTVNDAAQNSNTAKVTLNIAKTPPKITLSPSPAANANGWNNTSVTVSFSCAATTAPLATCSQSQTATTEGANQVVTGTVTDVAGNTATAKITLNIGETPPTIAAAASPSSNAMGWNNSRVTVSFTCTPGTAPIATCPQSQTISTEGANQVVTGTVADVAGNTATTQTTLSIATTLPTITASVSPPPNSAGWNNSAVTVSFTCTNTTAPIASCPPSQTVSTPGANQVITGTATDVAGNSATASVTLNIETTPPVIAASVSPVPNAAGWNNSNVTITYACSATTSPIVTCPQTQAVSTEGANQVVCVQVLDAAGNTAPACVTISIDKTPPTISVSISPAANAAGWNNSNVTVTFACAAGTSPILVCPPPQIVSKEGVGQAITGTVQDLAGSQATASVTLNIDKTAPTITVSVSPAPNANGWESNTVTVTFACIDALSGVALCPPPVVISTAGVNQTVSGTGTDVAGNTATTSYTVNLESAPPLIKASVSPSPNAAGWNNTNVVVTFTCTQSTSPLVACPSPQTVSAEGAGQVIPGTVQDQAGNQATTSVTLNIGKTPPVVAQFAAPNQLSPGQSGTATLLATDNIGITSVVFLLNGAPITTLLGPPFTVTVTPPSSSNPGDTLTLTAIVSDIAGNSVSPSRGIQVVSAGVLVGQVLSDLTGLPLQGASVQVVGATAQATSDNQGRYSIPVNNNHLFLSINTVANSNTGIRATVSVEREVSVQSGVGTVPVDARMTPLAPAIPINSAGGSLKSGSLTISVPAGGVSSATNFHLTSLSQQGLPGLLPLGWSPVSAFDLRSDTSTATTFNANFANLPNSVSLHLASYNYNSHAWTMVTPNLGAVNGALTIPVPSVGAYALVTADAGNVSIQIPSAGQPLAGVAVVTLPPNTSSSGSLSPASVSPTGGTSLASLAIQSPSPLPSGTVIQANVTETYALTSGKQLSDELRTEDILLYQFGAPSGAAVTATFPVTPSQTFQIGQLSSGDVHLDILSGRESVRGQVGGSDALSTQGGNATLTVAAGSLPQDTAIAVSPGPLDSFLPTTNTLTRLAEYNIDFSGQILNSPAQLSVAAGNAQTGDNIFLAQIQRVAGFPYLVVVSLAQVNGSNLVTQAVPGLPGITQGGDYVFYKLTAPTGFVSGAVRASSGPITALVQTDGLPFVAFSSSAGSFVIPAIAGPVNLTASIPNTALSGSASVQVTAGQTASANISVVGQVESATVTPANGSVGVPLTAEIDVTATDAFNPATVTASSVTLTQTGQGSSAPVAIRFVFSQGNAKLAVFPQSALQPSTKFTFAASGLANALGGLTSVPTVSFTTQAITPPNFNTDALVFAMPDANGNVAVTAPANSFPPGSKILIVDQTNGVVLSLTVFNDGSVSGQMPATIDDILAVTITAPDKTTASFTRSQFVAPDGTTAVGPGGGTVSGPGNTGLIIPEGTLNKGATFKLTPLDQTAFPQLPSWPGLNFGSGLHVDAPAMPTFNKEVKLAFPVPAGAPGNAFYYVYRRITDQNGKVYFETIDHAFVQGTGASAQVVTASPPFCGYHNPTGNFNIAAAASFTGTIQFSPFQTFVLMWDIAQPVAGLPGIGSPGLIVGLVQQIVPPGPGQPFTTYQRYVNKVIISLDADPSQVATYNGQCSTFSIFDPHLGGGVRSLTATDGTNTIHAAVDEVNGIQVDDATYAIYAGLEGQYRNIGRVTLTFPPTVPPPPPPRINIAIAKAADGLPISGIIQTGTNLNITFSSTLTVTGATINGATFSVTPLTTNGPADGLAHYRLSDPNYPYNVGNTPGLNTVVATAVDPLNPNVPINASKSFLVVAAGGTNTAVTACTTTVQNCTPPMVLAGTTPENNATGVSPSVFPQITFSEPVTHVPGNVTLVDHLGVPVPMLLIGVKPNGTIADPVQPSDPVTSLTLQPLQGLKFNETYKLTLNAKNTSGCIDSSGNVNTAVTAVLIVDLNQPPSGPLCLPPFPLPGEPAYQFTTFGPQELGGTQNQFGATRPVIIGKRAFLGIRPGPVTGELDQVDITDPSNPIDLGPLGPTSFIGLPLDAAGQAGSPVTGGGLVAIAAGQPPIQNILPSNVWLYDVSDPDHPARVGAVSATTSTTQDGTVLRLFMKDQFLYTSTFLKGLEVIDLNQAVAEYQSVFSSNPSQFGQAVSTEGNGFATDTVVNTIPLYATNFTVTMYDLKGADYVTGPAVTQTLVLATGRLPLVVADPQKPGPNGVLYPPADITNPTVSSGLPGAGLPNLDASPLQSVDGKFQLRQGRALALGTLPLTDSQGNSAPEQAAIIVGTGVAVLPDGTPAPGVLAVVNVNDPKHPMAQGFVGLTAFPTDVVFKGTIAIISTGANKILLVNLNDPTHPANAGEIDASSGSVFGDRLAVTDDGLIVTSSFNSTIGGVHTSSLGVVPQIAVDPSGLLATPDGKTSQDIPINYKIFGDLTQVASAQVQVKDDTGQVVFSTPVPVQPTGSVTWPSGQPIHVTPATIKFQVQNPDGGNSDFLEATPENTFGDAPTPVILSASPALIVVNSSQQVIDILGRNFLTSTQAQFIAPGSDVGGAAALLSIQFISSTEVKLTLTPNFLGQLGDATLRLLNGTSQSNDYAIHIVPPGLPPAPTLSSINPSQLPLTDGSQDTLITLSGTNFIAGDTIVRTDSEGPSAPPELTAQVTSTTSVQVTIPANWQIIPDLIMLYVQSTKYPLLQSQALAFQIGDGISPAQIGGNPSTPAPLLDPFSANTDGDPTTLPAPRPPLLSSVGDGFVALVASDATQPTTVTLQGSGFQAGGAVVVDVDGLQTSLSPASVSENQVQVQLPPALFKLRTYTFDFQVNLQNLNPGHPPLHAQQQNNSGKVIFRDRPLYAAAGPNYRLGGFHSRTPDKTNQAVPFDYYLMVPEQSACPPSPCSNKAVAVIGQHVLQPQGTKVSFDQQDPALIDRNPALTQSPIPVTVTVIGKNENADQLQKTDLVANKNVTANGQTVKTKVGTLQAQLIQRHHYAVYLHYVTETPVPPNPSVDPNFPCQNLPLLPGKMPRTQALYDNRVQTLEAGLNHIWNQQANVQFDVYPVQGSIGAGTGTCQGEVIPEQVHYDLNNDHNLLITDPNPPHSHITVETNSIIQAIQVSHPPQLPQGVERQIHVYFVRSFLIPFRLKDAHVPGGLTVGTQYAMTFDFDGGVGPYQFNTLGQLPPGLAFTHGNTSIRISGTPLPAGVGQNYGYQFSVTDSEQNPVTITININFPQILAAPNHVNPQWGTPPGAPNPMAGYTLGFVTQIGADTIFVDDRTKDTRLVHVLAHELGHALNMTHLHERTGVTCIQNLAHTDSDYADENQLMWYLDIELKRQSHIGIQQLWQKNGNLIVNNAQCH